MFSSDKPINSNKEDELNRTTFSKMLAKAILCYKKEDTLVLGLCGSWGSGKSSIINLVLEDIDNRNKTDKESNPIIIKFNPWNYSDSNQLINQFFQTVSSELKKQDKGEKLSKVGEALDNYSSLINYTQFIPVVGPYLKLVEPAVKSVGKQLSKERSLEVQKKAVIDALKNQSRKILIIIDDIDRINNLQIRAIFQLVNTVANFPNVVYLLSFDREIVARALTEEQKCDGEKYLEKIIQVPIDIPKINKNSILGMFYEKYTDIIKMDFLHPEFDKKHWDIVFKECICPFLDNIRDLKRILNVFEFKYDLMKGEINAVDLLAITVLEIYAKEIYEWIRYNISRDTYNILGAGDTYNSISAGEIKENIQRYNEQFKSVYPDNPQLMERIIKALFPKVAGETNSILNRRESEIELIKQKRVAASTKVNYYFNLSLEEVSIRQSEIEDSLFKYEDEQLFDFLKDVLKREALYDYLNEVLARKERISKGRRPIIINGIIKLFGIDISDRRQLRSITMSKIRAKEVIKQLMFFEDENKNLEVISNSLAYLNKNNIFILIKIYDDLKDYFNEDNLLMDSKEQIIKKEDLPVVEKIVLNAIDKLNDQIFESDCYNDIIRIWNSLDHDNMEISLREILKNDISVPKFLSIYVGHWSSSSFEQNDEKGWLFEQRDYEKYISSKEAYKAILRLKNNGFVGLKGEIKKIAIAFTLWFERDKSIETDHINDISEKDVLHRLNEWEINEILQE